jgi:hypothetical protein
LPGIQAGEEKEEYKMITITQQVQYLVDHVTDALPLDAPIREVAKKVKILEKIASDLAYSWQLDVISRSFGPGSFYYSDVEVQETLTQLAESIRRDVAEAVARLLPRVGTYPITDEDSHE